MMIDDDLKVDLKVDEGILWERAREGRVFNFSNYGDHERDLLLLLARLELTRR